MEYKPVIYYSNLIIQLIFYWQKTTNTDNEETITHEQLVLSLRNVLTSTGKFAQYCIPMLIEKLESDIPTARLAAMDVFVKIQTIIFYK
jgi:DNA repair/transcription protein MET18/MMS19